MEDTAYLPLLEVTLFTIGKFLGWDRETLMRHYEMIPNVLSLGELEEGDMSLFDPANRSLVFRIIPDALKFGPEIHRELTDTIRMMLAQA